MSRRELFVKTDKALIASLPRFLFEGPIFVIQSETEARRAVSALRRSPLIGIDTETRPAFRKGVVHRVALLQMATSEACFLFRLCHMGLPEIVVGLLSDPDVVKVGLSLKDDLMMLRRRHDFQPAGFVELQTMASAMGIEDMSLQKLYANLFRKKISKNARLTNWEADALTEAQQRYAATDAFTCLQIYNELLRLEQTGDYRLIPPVQKEEEPKQNL